MPAYVARPAIALPEHVVTTDDICDDIERHHADHPKLGTYLRVARASGVRSRRFTRPLDSPTVSGGARIKERNLVAFEDCARLAAEAARQALANADLEPSDIDSVVTSHTTSWTTPGLDVHLINALGLRPDVRRTPMASLGCGGGAQALARAADEIMARPDSRVLVVAAETLSTIYRHEDTDLSSMIYKALFGDGAGACVVTGERRGPGLRIDGSWEYLLPNSLDRYWCRVDELGLHFDSTRKAVAAAGEVLPELLGRLKTVGFASPPEWAVVHAGGPRILDDMARGLGIDEKVLRHSWNSMENSGNLGGVSVLDVLARTYEEPPEANARGLLVAFGPGFFTTACHGVWSS
ncbi:3-oxoacyl-[acyl-carrier-protein] synthase III C-terminal domain-containing protein [Streptomyces sp. I05A-00742]|uniref:3-oxoacyl-[acyl-carrier-protein] synthase III C-terminal domain-containing protein n=1 Tax=Streptomyces sp. I05A-00742 TaxID=2732853 RepID=UPI00148762C6|nr:3-oxoacyl-[acyl-carrier-protein] synthase III C-terminal domain-containing protein [Streptomyces sp. I05A-00742]